MEFPKVYFAKSPNNYMDLFVFLGQPKHKVVVMGIKTMQKSPFWKEKKNMQMWEWRVWSWVMEGRPWQLWVCLSFGYFVIVNVTTFHCVDIHVLFFCSCFEEYFELIYRLIRHVLPSLQLSRSILWTPNIMRFGFNTFWLLFTLSESNLHVYLNQI